MKIQSILMSMLVVATLAGCSSEDETNNPPSVIGNQAYVSLKVSTPYGTSTRASSSDKDNASTEENAIHSLYAVTFDVNNNIIAYGTAKAAQVVDITGSKENPKAFVVSSNAKGLLLIANPGAQLKTVLENAQEGMNFNALNAAITSTTNVNEIIDNAAKNKGFAMINSGSLVTSDTDASENATKSLIELKPENIKVVGPEAGQFDTSEEAKQAAEANRVTVNIERLASKIIFEVKDGGPTVPANAAFAFTGWALDATNTKFYPWAKKVDTGTSVGGNAGFYTKNFYTIDPNYDGHDGIAYNKIVDGVPCVPGATNSTEVLTWLADKTSQYSIENTMRAAQQLFKNATRVIIKSTYYPDKTWSGDWFSYAGVDYKDLATLKAAYAIPTNVNLQAACNKFFEKVKDKVTATNFAGLDEAELDAITNGGELVKEDGCIRWYQGGLNYYWYEIRHDDGITANMAFAKYGIVRNNVYGLTLNSISKSGTPWYPSVDPEGGEKDPDPKDPIDEMEGYVGVTVKVMPWIKWNHNIDL